MRKIEFRGKRIDNGEWTYGSLLYIWESGFHYIHNGLMSRRIKPETIGQFTGLTDKKGKEIYEGDIVASVNYDGTISKDIVFYHDGNQGYGCYLPFGNDMDSCMGSDVKVIGNIHDNPELLGGSE